MDSPPRGLQVENHRAGKELEQKERKAWKGGNEAGRRVESTEQGVRRPPASWASTPPPSPASPFVKLRGWMEASRDAYCDQCSQGLMSHEGQSQKDTQADLYSCLLWVRLQPWHCSPAQESKALSTPSLPLQPPGAGNIQTGQEAGTEANTPCVFRASHNRSHFALRMLSSGYCYFHLIHGETGAQRGSPAAQSHPASEV